MAFLTRALKAPTLREAVARLAERARAESWTHEEFLVACLQREVSARESHGGEGRIRAARFPARKSLEEFDFDHARGLKRDIIAHLGTLDFVTARTTWSSSAAGGWLTLRISPIGCVEQSSLVGFYLDTQAFAASAVDVDGLQLAALDLVQHGLSGDAEGFCGLVEAEPALGCLGLDSVAEGLVDADSPGCAGCDLFGGDKAVADPSVEGFLADGEDLLGFGDGDHDGIIVAGSDIGLGGRLVDGDGVVRRAGSPRVPW